MESSVNTTNMPTMFDVLYKERSIPNKAKKNDYDEAYVWMPII